MSLSQRVGRNAAAQLAGRLTTSGLAFVITALVLPRQLGAEDFGVFAFHVTLYQLVMNVLDFGAGTIVIREMSRRRDEAGELLGLLVKLKGLVAAGGVLLLMLVALLSEQDGTRRVLLVLGALHMLIHAPAGVSAIFHVDMAFRRHVLATVLGQTAWLAATLVLVLLAVHEPVPYVLAFAAGPLVAGVLGWTWARRRVQVSFDAPPGALRDLWRQAWPAGVAMTAASVYFHLDTAMLRPLAGEVATAHYSAAYRLMTFLLMVPVLFSQVVFPVYSRLAEGAVARLSVFHGRTVATLAAIGLLVPATVPQVADEIMRLVYPADFAPGAEALVVLCFAVPCVFLTYPHVQVLLARGHQRVQMRISLAAAAFNVLANLWAIPRWGLLGAAWTTVATEGIVLVGCVVCCRRLVGVSASLPALARPVAATLGAAGLLLVALPAVQAEGALVEAGLRVSLAMAVAGVAVFASGILPLDLGTEEGAPGG